MILYSVALSGHCHRVRLMLSLLGLAAELREVDLRGGAQHSPEFLALNPFGQVPVLVDGDVTLADSNAILVYLATRHDPEGRWYPADAAHRAEVQRWLSVAAGPLASGPAVARIGTLFGVPLDIATARKVAAALFDVLDRHLTHRAWTTGEAPTLADVALYSYTAHAPEGGIDLASWPAIDAWLKRVEALPGFVPMVPR